jgi:hypothetical protein
VPYPRGAVDPGKSVSLAFPAIKAGTDYIGFGLGVWSGGYDAIDSIKLLCAPVQTSNEPVVEKYFDLGNMDKVTEVGDIGFGTWGEQYKSIESMYLIYEE